MTDEDTTIYLFGTVHVLPRDVNWYDARIAKAFDASDELVTEIDMSDMTAGAQLMLTAGKLEGGLNLRGLMSEKNRAEYETALTGLGMPVEALDGLEPWLASINLSMLPLITAGYDPASGVEMALTTRGAGKTRGALETLEEQVALFNEMLTDTQLTMLDKIVQAVPDVAGTVDTMVDQWLVGDADALGETMNSEMDDPALYQRMLVDRNANWVDWIEQRLEQPGTVFVAVGAGHLAGAGSVQDLLGQRGYKVERIYQ